MTERTKLGALESMQWISEREAQYLNWKYAVQHGLPFDGKIYDRNKVFEDKDPFWPGLYVYGQRTCGSYTAKALGAWKNGITNPKNIVIIAGFGAVTAKSAAPRAIAGNILSELIIMFVTYTVIMAAVVCLAVVVDLIGTVPLTLYRIKEIIDAQDDPSQQQLVRDGLACIPFIEREKLEFKQSSFY